MAWHFQLDNPNFLGWSVVTAYLLAAICCGRVAWKGDKSADETRVWWILSGLLVFLGVNKQLNLQTLMLDIGRHIAWSQGWFGERRHVQAIFAAAFAAVGLILLGLFMVLARRFIRNNRLAFAGMIVILFFVVLRSSTINHIHEIVGFDPRDEYWAWVLELTGSFLIAWSALAAAPLTGPARQRNA
jgi:hypothetical protein